MGMRVPRFDGIKIFSATKAADRLALGERITAWMGEHPDYQIVDRRVTQSSDSSFHCLAITIFWKTKAAL
jgi:hypothetical protein